MLKSKISYLVLSDVHLGNNRTKTDYIIDNLHTLIEDNHNMLKKLDIWFIAGDLYDKLLASSSTEFILVNKWLSTLAMYCTKYDIKLRILEGTPSHDWRQVSVFSTTIETLGISLDYKYVDQLSIEYLADLDMHILYVPDEWNNTAEDTYVEVVNLLHKYNIPNVDIAIMHGQFAYQLPMVELPSSHIEDDYLKIVKYYINIGHIHTSSAHGRILAQGSFDRLAHNEEEPKGCMLMNIHHTGDMDFLFLKNKNAYPYRKYDLTELNTSEIIKYITKELRKLKLGTRVRLIVANNEVNKLLGPVQDTFKDIIFTIDKKKAVTTTVIKDNRVVIKPFEIRKDNLEELLTIELHKNNLSNNELSVITEELINVL